MMSLRKIVYSAKKIYIEDNIPGISNLATNACLNTEINDIKDEIPHITVLAAITALVAVENKIPIFSNLVKKETKRKLTITQKLKR